MEIAIICEDCESPLTTYAKEEDGQIKVMVEVCPHCIARKILMADEPWVRRKLLKEGNAA